MTFGRAEKQQVAELMREAATADRAWNELVLLFTPEVLAAIRRHNLPPEAEELAARAVWSSLARHLTLHSGPEDLESWLGTRVRQECARVAQEVAWHEPETLQRRQHAAMSAAGLTEHRSLPDRRAQSREQADRRAAGRRLLSPDVLAALLRRGA